MQLRRGAGSSAPAVRRGRGSARCCGCTVPTGMLASGRQLPGLMSAAAEETTVSPAFRPYRRQDVAKLAVFILDQGDERAAVGVVLEALHDSGHIQLVAAEIDDSVLALVAAAAMADGDAAVAVAAGVLLERSQAGCARALPFYLRRRNAETVMFLLDGV